MLPKSTVKGKNVNGRTGFMFTNQTKKVNKSTHGQRLLHSFCSTSCCILHTPCKHCWSVLITVYMSIWSGRWNMCRLFAGFKKETKKCIQDCQARRACSGNSWNNPRSATGIFYPALKSEDLKPFTLTLAYLDHLSTTKHNPEKWTFDYIGICNQSLQGKIPFEIIHTIRELYSMATLSGLFIKNFRLEFAVCEDSLC